MSAETILVVEDEILVGEEIREDLEQAGYYVPEVVTSGEAVLSSVARHNPDLILMDIRLDSRIDGIDAAQQVKAFENIPIIFLTAYSDTATLARAAEAAPSAYLLKPFNVRELMANVSMALSNSKKREVQDDLSHTGPLLNALDVPAVLLDTNGQIQQANPQMLSVLNINDLSHIKGESISHYLRTDARGKKEKHVLIAANGKELEVIPGFETITASDGRSIGTLVLFDQMSRSERRHLESSAFAANEAIRTLLPGKDDAGAGYAVSGLFLPSPSGSGDLYDVFRIDQDYFAFYSLDVMGHGTLSALIAFSLHNTIRLLALAEPEKQSFLPMTLVGSLNERYMENGSWTPFFSILYGVVKRSTGDFSFVRAGHSPLIHLHADGRAEVHASEGTVLGVFEDIRVEESYGTIARGEHLILCSDGMIEDFFYEESTGLDALLKALDSWCRRSSDSDSLSLADFLRKQIGSTMPRDDMSLLVISRNSSG